MRTPILLALAFAAAAPAAAAERRYTVTDFDRIQVDGPYRVTVTTGRPSHARAIGSNAALDRVSVDVEGRMLRIRPNASAWGGNQSAAREPVTLEVSTAALRAIGINGGGIVDIDKAEAMRLDLALAGSGIIHAGAVDTDSLYIDLFGSGRIEVAGKTKTVRAEIHGSGDLAASALTAADAQIFADTAGTIRINVTRSASVVASATGDVEIAGNAACTVKAVGTGAVRCGK